MSYICIVKQLKQNKMTTANLNEFVSEGKKMTTEEKMSEIKLSNYDKIVGFNNVIVKRNNTFKTIQAFYLEMFENIYTLDGRLIANRIS
jgi:hypothetical protein